MKLTAKKIKEFETVTARKTHLDLPEAVLHQSRPKTVG